MCTLALCEPQVNLAIANMNSKRDILYGEMHSLNSNFRRMKTQIPLYFKN